LFEKKENFEVNWAEKSGEDNSAIFSPTVAFLESMIDFPIEHLPAGIAPYVAKQYN
jgi:hypothetical protein